MLEVRPKRKSRRQNKPKALGKWLLYAMCLMAVGLLAAGGTAVYRVQHSVAVHPGIPEEIQVSQDMVRGSIREEFKSSFSPVNETVMEKLPEDKIRVSGWVDVMTTEGVSDRQIYSIIIFRNGVGDWVGEKISVIPQM